MNIPPVSISAAKAALMEQYSDPVLRRRASMLWARAALGSRPLSASRRAFRDSAGRFGLTTIEPVDIRGAIYADDTLEKTVWFPRNSCRRPTCPRHPVSRRTDRRRSTAPDSAYSLILDRRVGNYRLPDGWQIIAAGNASFHGAVSHDMGTALADRMFHFNVQTVIDAFLDHATAMNFAPEVMAYLKIRPDKLDDTQAQSLPDYLIGASPRGWEDISNVLKSGLSNAAKRVFVQGESEPPTPRSFLVCCARSRPAQTWCACWRRAPAGRPPPAAEIARRPLWHDLWAIAASADERSLARALEIVEQLPDIRAPRRCRSAKRRRCRWNC